MARRHDLLWVVAGLIFGAWSCQREPEEPDEMCINDDAVLCDLQFNEREDVDGMQAMVGPEQVVLQYETNAGEADESSWRVTYEVTGWSLQRAISDCE